jgi:hypothetical protein
MTTATIGHLALHYRPGDYERARALFEALGAHLEDNGPPGFCTIVFDHEQWNHVDNVMYLSQAGSRLLDLDAAISEALGVGTDDEDPRLTAFREQRATFPEALDHVGVRYSSYDAFERAVLAVQALTEPGGALEGRATVTRYHVRPGQDADADATMTTSPVFRDGDADGPALTDYGVQVFVRTDVCSAGPFALGQVFELDHYWAPAFEHVPDFNRR